MLFIISAFLYSAKFWPDVYNYINANITIKRIPTISELNPVFVDEVDFTTEVYSTTDNNDYIDTFTADDNIGLSFDDFLNDAESKRRKRQIPVEEMKISFEVKKAINDDTFDFEVSTRGFAGDLVDVDKLTTTNSKDVQIIFKPENCVKSDDSDDINDDGEAKNTNINVSILLNFSIKFTINNDNESHSWKLETSFIAHATSHSELRDNLGSCYNLSPRTLKHH